MGCSCEKTEARESQMGIIYTTKAAWAYTAWTYMVHTHVNASPETQWINGYAHYSGEAMKIRGWGETTAVCNCWGYLPPSGGRSTPLELSSLISEEAAAWCAAVWVQQSLSRSSICQHGYGWSSAAVSPVVGQPPGIPCDGVAPKDPWLVQVSSAPQLLCWGADFALPRAAAFCFVVSHLCIFSLTAATWSVAFRLRLREISFSVLCVSSRTVLVLQLMHHFTASVFFCSCTSRQQQHPKYHVQDLQN